MKKIDLITEINALKLEGVNFPEDTKTTIPELKLVLRGAGADAIVTQLKAEHKAALATETNRANDAAQLVEELSLELENTQQELADIKAGGKKATLPVVQYKGKRYRFAIPSFQLSKQLPMTADEAKNQPKLFPELIKKQVLILEKEA